MVKRINGLVLNLRDRWEFTLGGLRLRQCLDHRAAQGVAPEKHAAAAVGRLGERLDSFGDSYVDCWGNWHTAHTLRQSYPQLKG